MNIERTVMKINSNVFSSNLRIFVALISGKIPRYVLGMFWKQANGSVKSLVLNWNEYVDAVRAFIDLGARREIRNERGLTAENFWALFPNSLKSLKVYTQKCLVDRAACHMSRKEVKNFYLADRVRQDFKRLLEAAKILGLINKNDQGHSYYTQAEALVAKHVENYKKWTMSPM
jgi:hypothetical protein